MPGSRVSCGPVAYAVRRRIVVRPARTAHTAAHTSPTPASAHIAAHHPCSWITQDSPGAEAITPKVLPNVMRLARPPAPPMLGTPIQDSGTPAMAMRSITLRWGK